MMSPSSRAVLKIKSGNITVSCILAGVTMMFSRFHWSQSIRAPCSHRSIDSPSSSNGHLDRLTPQLSHLLLQRWELILLTVPHRQLALSLCKPSYEGGPAR